MSSSFDGSDSRFGTYLTVMDNQYPDMKASSMSSVEVDRKKCQGHGQCVAMASGLFELDDDGFAVVLKASLGTEDLLAAQDAEDSCPEQAITLEQ